MPSARKEGKRLVFASDGPETPCAVMFDLLKRRGGIKHNELAAIVLSGRPLSDGRSPVSRAGDRSWVSRFVVHAPVGSLQPRYFADYSASALRVTNRLRSRRGRVLSDRQIIDLVCGEEGRAMDRALAACHQSAHLYRNALERLAGAAGHTAGERAEALMVLFVAAGCSADAKVAVAYTLDCARVSYEMRTSTPAAAGVADVDGASGAGTGLRWVSARAGVDASVDPLGLERPFGLMRVSGGYIAGAPHWIDPACGAGIGALAMEDGDIADVEPDVSAEHARIWRDDDGSWLVEDLGSKNGTVLVDGATGEERRLAARRPVSLRAGDELRLASSTVFVAVEGVPGVA